MEKIKKGLNLKIISIVINASFLFTNSIYSYPIFKDSLRVPIGNNKRIIEVINSYRENNDAYSKDEVGMAIEQIANETKKTYDKIAPDYANLRQEVPHKWDIERLNRLLILAREKVKAGVLGDLKRKIHLLDRGTGSGRDLKWFYGNTKDVVFLGIDNSKGFIDLLRKRIADGDLPEDCVAEMDITDAKDISNESYDVVRDNTSILCLPDVKNGIFQLSADRAVAEAYRILKPGGVYFVMVKAGDGFQAIDSGEGLGVRYFQLYNSNTLKDLLERNGFIVPKVEEWIDHRPSGDVKMLYVYAEKPVVPIMSRMTEKERERIIEGNL